MSGGLEQRYRRVLRILPSYYRKQWEEDMVTAFLESSLTGDPEEDEFITEYGKPSLAEIASVAGLAARLYLGGAGAPRRYFAWGQATRWAVLVVLLEHAVRALAGLVFLAWAHRLLGWLPVPPARVLATQSGTGIWPAVWYAVGYAWIVAYLALVLGYRRTAQVIAVLAISPDLIYLLQSQFGIGQVPRLVPWAIGPWAMWILIDLVPVLAMAAFHRDAPPVERRPWLRALPVTFLLVAVPLLAVEFTGHDGWVPGAPGLFCVLVAVACLVHAPRARSRATSGIWSLTLMLLAADTGLLRILTLGIYPHDPRMIWTGLAELAVMVAAAAVVAPDVRGLSSRGSRGGRALGDRARRLREPILAKTHPRPPDDAPALEPAAAKNYTGLDQLRQHAPRTPAPHRDRGN